ncbi:MAG: hypothetical protein DMF56_13785 [Acidobacteria bacterium]|nr:MAG: hypothetical protein DMF56_13785 [Acidobacteriota bacterium]
MTPILPLALTLLLARSTEFAKYPPAARLHKPAATPDVRTGRAHHYRTRLREEAKEGANYDGHYRVAMWGCGSNCMEWAVIDLATVKVWMAPEPVESYWSADFDSVNVPDWMEYYKTSALLYVHAWTGRRRDRTFDMRRVYVWKNGAPQLLRTENVDY